MSPNTPTLKMMDHLNCQRNKKKKNENESLHVMGAGRMSKSV